jgi:flagellar protein FliS
MSTVLTEQTLHQKSPQELTSLLYQACMEKLEKASEAIRQQNYLLSNRLLQSCNDILYRLGAGLNYEAGIIADQLEAIYNYMAERLIQANLTKDASLVEEVLGLLKIIDEAWSIAMEKGQDAQSPMFRKKALAYEQDFFLDNGNLDRKE